MSKPPNTLRSTLADAKSQKSLQKSPKPSKSVRTPISSSRSKPTTTAKKTPRKQPSKKSPLSAEFVVESDIEDDELETAQENGKEPTGSTKKAEAVKAPVPDEKRDNDSKKKTTVKGTGKPIKGLPLAPPPKSTTKGQDVTAKPTDVVDISSDESSSLGTENEDERKEQPVLAPSQINGSTTVPSANGLVNGTHQGATAGAEQDTDSEAESDSSSENEKSSPNTKPTAAHGTKSSSEVEKSDYGNSQPKGGSKSDGARSAAENAPDKVPALTGHTQGIPQTFSSSGDIRPSAPFEPPEHFMEIEEFRKSTAVSSELRASLKGKQIWYITAPAGVKLKQLETLSLEKAGRGEAVITHGSSEYGLLADTENSKQSLKIILPGHDGYTQLSAPIDQVFHVQQITSPKLEPAPTSLTGKRKREQPEGLRMRWKPAGFISGIPGTIGDENGSDGDIEVLAEPPRESQFKMPSKVPSISPVKENSKKRKDRAEDDTFDKNPKKPKTARSSSSKMPPMDSKHGIISEPNPNGAADPSKEDKSKKESSSSAKHKSSSTKNKSDSRKQESKSSKNGEGKEKLKQHNMASGIIPEAKEKGESKKEKPSRSTKSESETHKSKSNSKSNEKEKPKSGNKTDGERREAKEKSDSRKERSSTSKNKAESHAKSKSKDEKEMPKSGDKADSKKRETEEKSKSGKERSSSKNEAESAPHKYKSKDEKEMPKTGDKTDGKKQETKEKSKSGKERSSSKNEAESAPHKSKSKDRIDEKQISKSEDKSGRKKSSDKHEKKDESKDKEMRSNSQFKDKAEMDRDGEKRKHRQAEKERAKPEHPKSDLTPTE